MKQKITKSLLLAVVGGIAFGGCQKADQTGPNPQMEPTSEVGRVATPSTKDLSPAQLAWVRFVEKVERGEQVDPTGQYVAKATQMSAKGERTARPKHDAAKGFIPGLAIRASGAVVKSGTANKEDQPTDPIVVCDGTVPCPGGGGGPTVTSTFVSSENLGGSGQIHDLKIVGEANSTSRARALNNGYALLNADLNSGAGGAYLYFSFVRDPANVLNAVEYYDGKPYSGPYDFLTKFETKNGSTFSTPAASQNFFDIVSLTQNPYYDWNNVDLNAGAGGEYIYSFQSKTPFVRQQSGGMQAWPAFSEIGILFGNSSTINPPSGWVKYPHDLNEGAGGDYIYFCYRL